MTEETSKNLGTLRRTEPMMTGIRYFATRVLLFCTRPALRYSCEHGEIFLEFLGFLNFTVGLQTAQ